MKKIPLSKGLIALVDDEDYQDIIKNRWSAGQSKNSIYAVRTKRVNGKMVCIKMHRQILKATPGQIIDHINGNTLDNRKKNLRVVTMQQNCMNRRKTLARSGIKGVSQRRSGKWQSRITINSKDIYLGTYETKELAQAAYIKAAKTLFAEFAAF